MRFYYIHFHRSGILISFLFLSCLLGRSWSQQPGDRITGTFRRVPLVTVLQEIELVHPVNFYFKREWFSDDTVTVELQDATIEESVIKLLAGKPFTYRIINKNQVVFFPRDEIAMLVGQLLDFSSLQNNDMAFIQVGKAEETVKSKTVEISGQVIDGKTSEPIIGAVIQVNNTQQGAVSNLQGNYKLLLAPGLYTLVISSVGYEKSQYNIKVLSNGELNMEMFDKSVAIDDIIIYGQRVDRNVSSHQMSLVELDTRDIKQLPSVAGGKDILKGLTTMPGIKSVGEFSSGINVRGGGEDQNLFLINGAPIFYTSHVFGLFSVINPDAVDKLTLYKGHIPSYYGERVSSVVDIRTSESAPEKLKIRGGIGTYDSRLMAEVPLYKNKVFFDLGGRVSYSDWILNNMSDYNLQNSEAFFYDLNGSLHIILPKGRISLSGYTCFDEFRFADEVNYRYGSTLGSLNWNYFFNTHLASYLSLSYSRYDVTKDDISSRLLQNRIESGISYTGLKYRLKFSGIRHHSIDAGVNVMRYTVRPGSQTPLNSESLVVPRTLESKYAYEGAVFLNDEYTVNDYLTFNAGLRFSGYVNVGPGKVGEYMPEMPLDSSSLTGYQTYGKNEVIQAYYGLEPRFSMKVQFSDKQSVKLSFNRNIQYLSLISYSSVSTPADIWKLSDPFIRPLAANQFAIGYYRNFYNNSIETSVEVYYKGLNHVIEYKDGAILEMNGNIENELIEASGRNYGVEFLLKKSSGKVDGWISYTYSRSLRKTTGMYASEMINRNTWFPASYDKPHDFSIIANYHVNKRLQFSANFAYSTGRPVTLPEYKYFTGNEVVVYFSDKNEYRIPAYHRLDLTVSLDESLRLRKKWKGSWSFSVLNVYGRKNAYTVYYKKEEPSPVNDYNRYSMYKLYLIGRPVPVISYSFIF